MLRFSLSRQRLIVGGGLCLLAAISWWSDDMLELPDDRGYLMAGQPDYFMRELEVLVQDPQGGIRHKLSASELAHFPNTQNTRFTQPKVEIYREQNATWVIEAALGVLNNPDQQLQLDNGVKLYQGNVASTAAVQLETETMGIELVKQQASSDGQVRLWQQGLGQMQGEGMLLDLQSNRLHLQSNVRVRYENN